MKTSNPSLRANFLDKLCLPGVDGGDCAFAVGQAFLSKPGKAIPCLFVVVVFLIFRAHHRMSPRPHRIPPQTGSFCSQIIEVLNALETFSVLFECKIEGIDAIAHRFNHLYATLKKKPYDPLDHRRPEFNVDFTEFQCHIQDLEVCLFISLFFILFYFWRGVFFQ